MKISTTVLSRLLAFGLLIFLVSSCAQEVKIDESEQIVGINLEEITISQIQQGYKDGSYTIE